MSSSSVGRAEKSEKATHYFRGHSRTGCANEKIRFFKGFLNLGAGELQQCVSRLQSRQAFEARRSALRAPSINVRSTALTYYLTRVGRHCVCIRSNLRRP